MNQRKLMIGIGSAASVRETRNRTMATEKKLVPNIVWGEKRTPSRGPKPGLSTGEIARAAIKIADKEGLEAVTMQKVARNVGVTTMALYRYFAGKADLLAVMIDSAGESAPDFDGHSTSWNDRLREWALHCAAIYRDHPWFLEATTIRHTMMGPNELSWMEAALAMLAEAGLSPRERYYAFLTIIGHIRAHATFEQMKNRSESPRRWIPELARRPEAESNRYAGLYEVLESAAFSGNRSEAFEYGLNCILEGIGSAKREVGVQSRGAR